METNFSEQLNALQDNYNKGVQDILKNISTEYSKVFETMEARSRELDDFSTKAFQKYLNKRIDENNREIDIIQNKVVAISNEKEKLKAELFGNQKEIDELRIENKKLKVELIARQNDVFIESSNSSSLQIKHLAQYLSKEITVDGELLKKLEAHKEGLLQKERSGAELTKEEENALDFFESLNTLKTREQEVLTEKIVEMPIDNTRMIESIDTIDSITSENKIVQVDVKDISEKVIEQEISIKEGEDIIYENNHNTPSIDIANEKKEDNIIDSSAERLSETNPELIAPAKPKKSKAKKTIGNEQIKHTSKTSLVKKSVNSDLTSIVEEGYDFTELQKVFEKKKYDEEEFKKEIYSSFNSVIEQVHKKYLNTVFENKKLSKELVVKFILTKLTKNE